MAVLPCLYVAMTVATGYGVYLFATQYFAAVWAWPIGMNKITLIVKVVCSCTPLLVGGAVTFAMIKPLFARRGKRMQPLALNPEVEPQVYSLVQQVCQIVGAPAPRRIELSCDLNASAGFASTWGGFFANRLVLTLGMPLVAGLTQRELAGVVAHEFGHFRQSAGLRVSYLIRLVNHWFARVIYGRDAWDEMLDDWSAGSGDALWLSFMVGCARFGVMVSRGVLWILMQIGHGLSASLLRQMEYDADRSAMRVGGSVAMESSMVRLGVLGAIMHDVHADLARQWRRQHTLPDNLPVWVEQRAQLMPVMRRQQLENGAGLGKTHWYDTHPSHADRVRRARRLAESGYEISDAPARELFENFEGLSRLVTLAYYDDDLEVPVTPDFLVPIEQILQPEAAAARGPSPEESFAPSAEAATAGPVQAKPRPAVPMMRYDPSQFQGQRPSAPTE